MPTTALSVRVGIYRGLKEAKPVAVRYDPSDPAVSCLSHGLNRSIQIGLTFSVVWLAFVFGFTILWRLSRPEAALRNTVSVP